jgi:hypothetical protein
MAGRGREAIAAGQPHRDTGAGHQQYGNRTAKLHAVDLDADTATVHLLDAKGQLAGVRTIDWPPPKPGRVTVIRTPTGIGEHQRPGATGSA